MIIFIADLHLDNWRSFSTIDPMGFNTRLQDQMAVVHQVAGLIERTKPTATFFLGDLFNGITEYLPKIIYRCAYDTVKLWSKHTQLYMIVGNHDIYKGMHMFDTFDSLQNTHIVSQPTHVNADGYGIDLYPWGSSPLQVKSDIACGHMEVKGAWMDASKTLPSEGGILPTDFIGYKYVLLGHFHEPQVINVKGAKFAGYIGAVMQTDLKSSPCKRGVTILDHTETPTPVEIWSPKIYKVRAKTEDDLPKIEGQHYYKISIPADSHLDDNLPKTHKIIVEIDDSDIIQPKRLDIPTQEFDLKDTVTEFINSTNRQIDKVKAIEYMKEVL